MVFSDLSIMMLPPPPPRSFQAKTSRLRTSGMKLLSQTGRFFAIHVLPLPEKLSASGVKRSLKGNGLLNMKSRLRKRFISGGAEVTPRKRAGLSPLPLKCCRQVLSGGENRLPGPHSKVTFLFSSFQTEVEPFPSTT